MPIHDFFRDFNESSERFSSIDDLPDNRSIIEQQHTPLSIYNHNNPDLALAERLASEIINISGAWVTLYIKVPRIDNDMVEDVWDEDADPLYQSGIDIKAFFKVSSLNLELTRWGIDAPLKLTFVFSRAMLAKEVGMNRLITVGDIIEAPYNAPKMKGKARFRVLNAYDYGMFKYRWLYYAAVCELITGDEALQVVFRERPNV